MKKVNLIAREKFEKRHHGKSEIELNDMLSQIGVKSVDELIGQTIPSQILAPKDMDVSDQMSENQFLAHIRTIADKNIIAKTYIGKGYYDTHVPTVLLRNILENPGWYTAYTPYQAEIAQGRLEMVLNFQTMVSELTSMELANASLLDEGTAAAEAMAMLFSTTKGIKKKANKFFVSDRCHPQTIDVVVGRAVPMGIQVEVKDFNDFNLEDTEAYGMLLQYPATDGEVIDYTDIIAKADEKQIKTVVAADLLSLALLKPPGEMGAHVVVGSTQRFGVPMGFGGPHAAYFACKEEYKRQLPGRIIGISIDKEGKPALRMALQTREQHIRREKATSNICTSQVLLAVMAGAFGVYNGPVGLIKKASRIQALTQFFVNSIQGLDYRVLTSNFFDTVTLDVLDNTRIKEIAQSKNINFWYDGTEDITISFDETKTLEDIGELLEVFALARGEEIKLNLKTKVEIELNETHSRTTDFMTHQVFNSYHTEHEMLRYLKRLENKDLSLVHSMISLGSCTMKLNSTTEMIPVTWPEFGQIHPFAPSYQTEGYKELIENFSSDLCEITGFYEMSMQPNSGASGEYAGLLAIKGFHEANGDSNRKIALIPSSAHGTNPASAVMAGFKVVVSPCDANGNIDMEDIKLKLEEHGSNLACLMVTYPSTHGVFEESIIDLCNLIHQHGGKVYMDGANMNAQVGYTSPGFIGADVCHLNLHKTFCIPHGGGGPGMGPIGVTKELSPYLPGHKVMETRKGNRVPAVSSAAFGSASILAISYAYIKLMGAQGLKNATAMAILNANYIKTRLETQFKILYSGKQGRCAHEMIVDCRPFKSAGVEVEDIAKRLMDYGFHAPTVSFPVAGTLMIEPTESESKEELDRFCDALLQIREEIREIEEGQYTAESNVLVNAPHTLSVCLGESWNYDYPVQKAAFPTEFVKENKFWPSVSRIDSAHGDRNLQCACLPIDAYV